MRKLTHKTHKIVPCKWNNWHNVSIKEYLTMALTPDLSAGYLCCSFLLKAYFTFVWPHVIYPPVLFVDNETRVVLISVTHGARWEQIAICFILYTLHAIIRPAGGHSNHYHAPLYSSSAPHSLMAPLSQIFISSLPSPQSLWSLWLLSDFLYLIWIWDVQDLLRALK